MGSERKVKYIIVGAGLSGLMSAYQLNKSGESNFIILESRDRLGGRISTYKGIDFGATWFQDHHHYVNKMLNELNISTFPQYSKGKSVLVYSSMAPAHYFESDADTNPANRIVGGTISMINSLAKSINHKIKLNEKVTAIEEKEDGITVTTEQGSYSTSKVIITIPPRIATRIKFTPPLPHSLIEVMQNTHTWMSNALKVGISFKKSFWRNQNLSGTIIGQTSPVVELYDHTNYENQHFSLMGFVNEALRDIDTEKRKNQIVDYLSKYLGEEVRDFLNYQEKDWSKDMNTSFENIKSIYMSPQYGHSIFKHSYLNNRLIFSGAETSSISGGYMDGAIFSGLNAVERILKPNG